MCYDSDIENEDEFLDVIMCPQCMTESAIIENVYYYGEVASCKREHGGCGYKWKMLIEPDPENFEISGLLSTVVPFNGDIFEVESERYERIINYSNLNYSEEDIREGRLPQNIFVKVKKCFERFEMELSQERLKYISSDFISFIENDELTEMDIVAFINLLRIECEMGVKGSIVKPDAIIYKNYMFNKLRMVSRNRADEIKEKLSLLGITMLEVKDDYKMELLTSTEELSNQVREYQSKLNGIYDLISEGDASTPIIDTVIEDLAREKRSNDSKKSKDDTSNNTNIAVEDENVNDDNFYDLKTTYGLTVSDLCDLIKNCPPRFSMITMNPFIMPLDEYIGNIKSNLMFPAMIDVENNLAMLHISHEDVIYAILEHLNIDYETGFNQAQEVFHENINAVQVFVNSYNRDSENQKLSLTISKECVTTEKLKKALDDENIGYYCNLTKFKDDEFISFNDKGGSISGEVYFPKENEENIPEGKILIVPTASEEYFLSSVSTSGRKGCIITEKGSKTSHLMLMSKEFDFNIILIENASEKFNEGDIITIDFERNAINKN